MVSANTITNTLGPVVIFDGECPRIFTAAALETVSGGALVTCSGATGDFGSGASSYTDGDIKVSSSQDPTLFNGIALNNAASGALVSVATRGAFLMNAAGIVSGGAWVGHNGSGCVQNWVSSVSGTALLDNAVVGRALTSCASGTSSYVLVSLLA